LLCIAAGLLTRLAMGGFLARFFRTTQAPVRSGDKITTRLRTRHNLTANIPVWRSLDVKPHNKATDLWLVIDNKVYDVTDFVEDHEGGMAILRKGGLDNTKGFNGAQHPAKVHEMIDEYFIGVLHEDDHFEVKAKPDTISKAKSS